MARKAKARARASTPTPVEDGNPTRIHGRRPGATTAGAGKAGEAAAGEAAAGEKEGGSSGRTRRTKTTPPRNRDSSGRLFQADPE